MQEIIFLRYFYLCLGNEKYICENIGMNYSHDDRLAATRLFLKEGDAKFVIEKYGVHIGTLYRWRNRYLSGGEEALRKCSTRPKKTRRIPEYIEREIIETIILEINESYSVILRELKYKGINISRPTIKAVVLRNKDFIRKRLIELGII